MQRNPRAPRRSTTPTSANFPSTDTLPPATPTSPGAPKPLYLCSPFVEAALVKGNFKTIVMLPKYADVMEWVAVNSAPSPQIVLHLLADYGVFCTMGSVFDFYQNLNQFYGVLAECCTVQSCPTMAAGSGYVNSPTSCSRSFA